jgi:group I intron endonuclease
MAYKEKSGIYKITSPSNKIYIGKSKNIKSRLNSYKKSDKVKTQVRLYNSFQKYGVENHIFEIIEECEVSDLYCRERYWQDFYDVLGSNGLNCILTACKEHPAKISEETRKKLSESSKGEKHPMFGKDWRQGKTQEELDNHKINVSNAQKGKKASEESKKRMSLNNAKYWKGKKGSDHPSFGRTLSDEEKNKIRDFMLSDRNPNRGKKQSLETIQKRISTQLKPVFNYYSKEKINSVRELSILLGKSIGCIRAQLLRINSNTIGWVYEEDLDKPLFKKEKKPLFTKEEQDIINECSLEDIYKNFPLLYRRYRKYNKDLPYIKVKWDKDTLKEEMLKYKTVKEVIEKNPSAYNIAKKLYPELTEHLTTDRIIWTEEKITEEIKKYTTLNELRSSSMKLYNVIHKKFRHLLPLYSK